MSVASLDFNNLNLSNLVVGNIVYSDANNYVNTNTTITTTENSSIISTGGLYSSGLITGDGGLDISGNISGNGGLDISGNITGDTVSSTVLLNSTGDTNIAGLGFFTVAGPITINPNSSAITTELFPFPSSSITQVMCTVGPINVSSGGLIVSAGIIAPFSDVNSTVKFLFYNPTLNSIILSNFSVILYNANSSGGLINII
jgi:hypothetical protein